MTTRPESLSLRLIRIKRFVSGRRVADVGCDHGKLVADLFDFGLIDYAFVSDISEPSVNKAVKLLSEKKRNFDFAVADGLAGIKPEYRIDEVVIAGMGGLEIIKILSQDNTAIKSFVLQPQNNEIKLKQFLLKNGFNIVRDEIVKDKHMFYNVLKAVKSNKKQRLSAFELRFGKDNFLGNLDFRKYLDFQMEKLTKIRANMPPLKRRKVEKEISYLKKSIYKIGRKI